MANEVTKSETGRNVPFSPLLHDKLKSLPDIDVAAIEEKAGVLLAGKFLRRAAAWDNFVFCAWLAQRERLEKQRQPVTAEALLGNPLGGGTDFRKILVVFWEGHKQQPTVNVRVRMPEGHRTVKAFETFLNTEMFRVVGDAYLGSGSPSIPQYSVEGIGSDIDTADGHSQQLLDVARDRKAAAQQT
ncbi:MAG: hypothetical protein RLZZ342_705 [Candidatus Parcubacteria bacterium]|jgi:hypothetical protein